MPPPPGADPPHVKTPESRTRQAKVEPDGFRSVNGLLLGSEDQTVTDSMLIVCPSCATSYMIDATSLGAGGRMVRCARCKATWFAGGEQEEEEVSVFVDEVIAEAEAEPHPPEPEAPAPQPFLRAPAGAPTPPPTVAFGAGPDIEVRTERQIEVEQNTPNFEFEPAPGIVADAPPAAAHRDSFEPHAIPDAPSLVPPMEQAEEDNQESAPAAEDVESFAARRQRLKTRRKRSIRTSHWTAAILLLFAVNVALILGRSEVVSYFPQTASLFSAIGLPVNLRQLKFENVSIKPNGAAGEGLTVTGTIVSTASKPIKVPPLRFAARNAAGQEIYTWTAMPARRTLDAGEKLDFRSDLASPPPDAKDVLVRFATAAEAAAMNADKPDGMMTKPGQLQ